VLRRLPAAGPGGGRQEVDQERWGFWQVAGSNNLLQSREDMRALVAFLNSKLTG